MGTSRLHKSVRFALMSAGMVAVGVGCTSADDNDQADQNNSSVSASTPSSTSPNPDEPSTSLPLILPEDIEDENANEPSIEEFCSIWTSEANPANLANEFFIAVGVEADDVIATQQSHFNGAVAFLGTVTQLAPGEILEDVERWSELERQGATDYLAAFEDAVRSDGENPQRSEMLNDDERAEWESIYESLNENCGGALGE